MEVVAEAEGEGGIMPVRIFVGGLGLSVTAQDLEKTFSSLGSINGVEIVRSSGRSFAYMDFQPTSSKALNKLFSMYNGCLWKGGRLKLEKAKEHYLVRLKREWDKEAEIANEALKVKEAEPVVEKKIDQSEKLKSLTQEAMQLNIYIPRFRKVKPLPFRGSGKHKYSFQRIEVPPLPIHFCDCEEHCRPVETTKQEPVNALEMETDAGVADEEELDMMRSVLDKILKRENSSGVASRGTEITKEVDDSTQLNDNLQRGDTEVDGVEGGEDDLVINMVSGENGRLPSMESQARGKNLTDKESNFRKRQFSVDSPTSRKPIVQKRKNHEPFKSSDHTVNKKARLVLGEESNQDVFTPTVSKKKGNSTAVSIEAKGVAKTAKGATPEQKSNTQPSAKALSWKQKSPWKKMVGETSDMAFSISHILPEASTENSSPISNDLDAENPPNRRKKNKVKKPKTKSAEKVSKDSALGIETRENVSMEYPAVEKKVITQDELTTASASTTEVQPLEDPEPTEKKTVINQPGGPSWKSLVGDVSNSTFSLTQILGTASSSDSKQKNLAKPVSDFFGEGWKVNEASKDANQKGKVNEASSSKVANSECEGATLAGPKGGFNLFGKNPENKNEEEYSRRKQPEIKSAGKPNKNVEENVVAAKVSPFIRSEASQNEWLKLKKSLSGSKKRKKGEEN